MATVPLVRAAGVKKTYGNLEALSETDFTILQGEVRALIGSNGAGKSTLIKILTGAITPTSGSVEIAGQEARLGDPKAMISQGIACIYQHANLAPDMTVLDNIFLGRQPTRWAGIVDKAAQRRLAEDLIVRFGIELELEAIVGGLPTVKQKEVEIAKALALDARVILMDEPTAWLAASEVAKLHATIRKLKSQGVGIVYISHVLDEIFAVCDVVTVLRDGRVVAEHDIKDVTRPRLVELMVGDRLARESAKAALARRHPRGTGELRVKVKDLTRHGVFRNVSFDLYVGEIFCITGLIGSKRSELLRVLFGVDRFDDGKIEIDGVPVRPTSPRHAIASGISLIPEDRHRDGLMLDMTVTENLAMASLPDFRRGLLIDTTRIAENGRKSIAALSIQPPEGARPVALLSGGNQQKVLVGKWLSRTPRIILLDEPTVGVDVGAKAEIYTILRRERERGAAILVVSSDLEEVMTIADRIGVMVAGELVAIHDAGKVGMGDIVQAMGGAPA
jgi:ABC-type sugar transport system ATPase subunit